LQRQELDDGRPVVRATGAADFVKLWMQQLFEALTAAANPWMMEFDFEGLEFLK
jgi:hypothetical protein